MTFRLKSPSFASGGTIPSRHTCDGKNTSPALSWEGSPSNTKSFVLLVDDPDAPSKTWTHWVVYNIPEDATGCPENSPPVAAAEGLNDFGNYNYGGPCPPSGTHRYFFKLYALGHPLNLPNKSTREEVEEAMKPHILATTELMGTYKRS